ncbi:hypothetical protein K466DRAFT_344372 [Polyporus arcularius HHB13444]|uniref:Uncharacterized protein n=1 Tax=Polyporus arcularius HHB13444 TaxID=1314778 RepID=A0A5C3NXK6_9APHY|nr:hypothetical protein K466DRAFT_344372 [Polyporus arcularius HHB13444]
MVKSGVPSGVPSRLVVSIGTPLPRPRPTSYRGILRLTQARNPAIDTPSTPRRGRGSRVSAALGQRTLNAWALGTRPPPPTSLVSGLDALLERCTTSSCRSPGGAGPVESASSAIRKLPPVRRTHPVI